jgi:hypothetical protein
MTRKLLIGVASVFLSFSSFGVAHAATTVSGTLSGDVVWTKANGPYVITNTLTIPVGSSLLVEPGVVVKMGGNGNFFVYVYGALNVNGTSNEPTVITSIKDDTTGGDTNADGSATSPIGGDWLPFYFIGGSHGSFDNTEIRYGGRSNGPSNPLGQIVNDGGNVSITNTRFSDSANFHVYQASGTTTISDSVFVRSVSAVRSSGGVVESERNIF